MVHDVKVTMLMANGESREIITVRAAAQKGVWRLAWSVDGRDEFETLAETKSEEAAASATRMFASTFALGRFLAMGPPERDASAADVFNLAKQAVDNTLNILVKAGLM